MIVAKHRLYDMPDHIQICKACDAVASEDTQRIVWSCVCAFDALVDSKHLGMSKAVNAVTARCCRCDRQNGAVQVLLGPCICSPC